MPTDAVHVQASPDAQAFLDVWLERELRPAVTAQFRELLRADHHHDHAMRDLEVVLVSSIIRPAKATGVFVFRAADHDLEPWRIRVSIAPAGDGEGRYLTRLYRVDDDETEFP